MAARQRPIKVGLEIHQQVATHKLFCNCDSRLVDGVKEEFLRRLRPTQSELGEVDRAALEEAAKDLTFTYQATDTSCLVEADEEPPQEANHEALETALQVALMLGAKPVPEVHFMRKIVIDGSNTTGFQRSALVALDGSLEVDGKTLGVPTICLEEDAARLMEARDKGLTYRLDRLGIPLIEIATTPDINSPEMARNAALKIGRLLRATRRVLRGLGTIREDLNVSVQGGARVEIKGVQDLGMISSYVQGEVDRQLRLLETKETLEARRADTRRRDVVDLTESLQGTESKVLRKAVGGGGVILGVALRGFKGLLSNNLGPELASYAAATGVGGILHSDELPAYGITQGDVEAIRSALGCGREDAFVLVADSLEMARAAMNRVNERCSIALEGVPEETRDARPDGSTAYSRPLPGSARMYPETDVPPIRITRSWLNRLAKSLPEPLEVKSERLAHRFKIHRQQADQIVDEGWDELFEKLTAEHGNAKAVARTFLNTLPELQAEGLDATQLSEETWESLFRALAGDSFAKEAIPRILKVMLRDEVSVEDAVQHLGLRRLGRKELEAEIEALIEDNLDLIKRRGEDAIRPLMGEAMSRLRGGAEGRVISEILREKVRQRLSDG